VGGSQLLLVSVAVIVVTFAALEWREAHELQHARAHRRRREWPAAPSPADSWETPARDPRRTASRSKPNGKCTYGFSKASTVIAVYVRAAEAIKLVHSQSTETCRPPPAS